MPKQAQRRAARHDAHHRLQVQRIVLEALTTCSATAKARAVGGAVPATAAR